MHLFVIHGNVLIAFVGVIRQSVKAHGPLVLFSNSKFANFSVPFLYIEPYLDENIKTILLQQFFKLFQKFPVAVQK